ncbi:MAG: alginate export family protein, partial [Verrucomicrobia bacterium]|nr:alginate export family protein [Verrucomicrobiota bacterium]
MKAALATMAMPLGLAVAQAQTTAPSVTAPAAPAGGQPAAAKSPTEQWIQDVKNPTSWLNWGADLRLRNEYVDNATTLGPSAYHEQDFFRYRARVSLNLTPLDNLDFKFRMVSEPREFMKRKNGVQGSGMDYTGNYMQGLVDNLSMSWKEIGGAPLSLSVGRQDIMLGEKGVAQGGNAYYWGSYWLVGDGSPLDGSRDYFLDSARVKLDLKDAKTTIEGIGILNHARNSDFLPTINKLSGFNEYLTEQNEVGGILYLSNKSVEKTQLDAYFIYKGDTAKLANGDTGEIYTLGAKVTRIFSDKLLWTVEGAYQFGHKAYPGLGLASKEISAYGFNSMLTYQFKDSLKDQFRFSFEFLSGSKPGSTKDNSFDILWGRYPSWSELYVNTPMSEAYGPLAANKYNRPGQYQNLIRFGPGWSFDPVKNLNFIAEYAALFAPESSMVNPTFGTG